MSGRVSIDKVTTVDFTGIGLILRAQLQETAEMSKIQVPEFKTYEEEAAFWDNLDTAPYMEDDGEWFHLKTPEEQTP
jgi:hypothetical protein